MRTRLEISIAYTNKAGKKLYANKLGSLWLDTETMQGSIDLPPGVSISSGQGFFVNVAPPFDERGGSRKPQGDGNGERRQARHDDGYNTDDAVEGEGEVF